MTERHRSPRLIATQNSTSIGCCFLGHPLWPTFEQGIRITSFQKAVKTLIDSPAKREQFSKGIRKTVVNHWTLERCKKEWEAFFLSLKKLAVKEQRNQHHSG